MSLASAFTLSRLSADLTYDLSKAPEVPEPVAVQCAISRGKIMVLVESPNVEMVPASYVFAQVETLVRHRLEIDGLPVEAIPLGTLGNPIPIKVYLKQPSVPRPSAVHRFNWLVQDSSGPISVGESALAEQEVFEPFLNQPPEVAPDNLFFANDDEVTGDLSEEEMASEEWLSVEEHAVDDLLNLDRLYDPEPEGMSEPVPVADEAGEEYFEDEHRRSSGLVVAGIGAAVVLGVLGYGLSRPCVLGRCDRIDQAQALGDAALISLSESPTPQTVLDMGDQLNTAVNNLTPIPRWSPHHSKAQELLSNYQGETDLLNAVAAAQKVAIVAANDSQNPPHPIAHWEGIAKRWQQAIEQLESIPTGSPIYAEFVNPKLEEYRGNLTAIENRVTAEQSAEQNLNQANLTSSLATQQTKIANTLPAWKTALDSWEKAVIQLKKIPRGTVPYNDAQQLLPKYESDLAKVRVRYQKEQAADQFYNEAVRHATTARQYESDDQWTLAMLSWRDAVTQVKGVLDGTVRYTDSQNLLKTYEPALAQAQENLRLAIRFQKAEGNFAKVCKPTFCKYGLKGGMVQLTLAKDYDALVDFSITDPNTRTSVPASDQMITDINQLLREVINIGKRTQLPIEFYGAQGGFIARFSPELEGYVKTVVVRPTN